MRPLRLLGAAAALAFSLGMVAGGSSHTLVAKGDSGWLKFWGHGTVDISGKGQLIVKNESNGQMTINGTWGEKQDITDSAIYTHFEGSVHSIGPGQHFEMRGWNLSLQVKGFGKAWFQGVGTTTLDGGPEQAWPKDEVHNGWLKVKFRD